MPVSSYFIFLPINVSVVQQESTIQICIFAFLLSTQPRNMHFAPFESITPLRQTSGRNSEVPEDPEQIFFHKTKHCSSEIAGWMRILELCQTVLAGKISNFSVQSCLLQTGMFCAEQETIVNKKLLFT